MSPFHMDTNDVIFQAVSQSKDIAISSALIISDAEWISFAAELNTILRTLHHHELHYGVLRLIQFLQKTQEDARLGEIVVEFCTFSNMYVHSEQVKERSVWDGAVPLPDLSEMEATNRIFRDSSKEDGGEEGMGEREESGSCCYYWKFDPFSAIPFSTTKRRPKEGMLPDGMSLSFSQMCFALKRGVLKMGVYVSHEKVAMNRYILGDADYCSDDDKDLLSMESWRFSKSSEDERRANFGLYLRSAVSSDAAAAVTDRTINFKKVYGNNNSNQAAAAVEMANFQHIHDVQEVASADERMLPQRRRSSIISENLRLNAAREKTANALPSNLTSPSTSDGLSRGTPSRRPTLDSNHQDPAEFIPRRLASTKINAAVIRENIFLEEDEEKVDVSDVEGGRVPKLSTRNLTFKGRQAMKGKEAAAAADQENSPEKREKFSLAKIFASSNVEHESTVTDSTRIVASKSLQRSGLAMDHHQDASSPSSPSGVDRLKSSVSAAELVAAKKILRPPYLRSTGTLTRASIAPPRMSTIRRRSLLSSLSKGRTALKDKLLAPSAFQQRINAWRVNQDDGFEPTSDGLAVLRATTAAAAAGGEPRRDGHPFKSEMVDDGAARQEMFISNPAFSFIKPLPSLSSAGSSIASDSHKAAAPTAAKVDGDRRDYHSATSIARPLDLQPTAAASATLYILLDFWTRLRNWLIFGSNIFPMGPPYSWKILAVALIALCCADIVAMGISFVDLYCVPTTTTSTECNNHDQLAIIIMVWPFAIILAPLSGIVAILLGPSAHLARIYCMFSHLAGINTIILLVTSLRNVAYITAEPMSIYPVFLLSCSRLVQCLLIDLYIAHIDRVRLTPGWDGLNTSLLSFPDRSRTTSRKSS